MTSLQPLNTIIWPTLQFPSCEIWGSDTTWPTQRNAGSCADLGRERMAANGWSSTKL
ncbi:hypothetical protein DPMN_027789 [Dreissena polymorpha]|uniref:Uncharacterized protein n=1 Tax=Dreissena polymorpha TaxID=45954 RepID=A0A9D4REP7_DREPO|nr:hypothetical protein DPMN_027789 [Dreissena polymorpha]